MHYWFSLAHSGSLSLAHSRTVWLTLTQSGSLWLSLTRILLGSPRRLSRPDKVWSEHKVYMIVHYPASARSRISGKKWAQVAALTPAVQRGQRKNVFLLVSSHDGKKNWTIFEEKNGLWPQKCIFRKTTFSWCSCCCASSRRVARFLFEPKNLIFMLSIVLHGIVWYCMELLCSKSIFRTIN